ncbi:MAG: hypothetical protein WED87_04195 [Dehalococcoidia bacterium]
MLPPVEQCALARVLVREAPDSESWRTWNHGRTEARDAIDANEPALREACSPND